MRSQIKIARAPSAMAHMLDAASVWVRTAFAALKRSDNGDEPANRLPHEGILSTEAEWPRMAPFIVFEESR